MTGADVEVGVINGRFQPFHIGHAEYLLASLKISARIIVGITNPDASSRGGSVQNPHRDAADSNPFTYFERMEMIRAYLLDQGIPHERFEFVPFPISTPELIDAYVPMDAVVLFTVYDAWGREKIARLSALGYNVRILWERPESSKVTTGSAIRRAIADGAPWQNLVPPGVYRYITSRKLQKRIYDQRS